MRETLSEIAQKVKNSPDQISHYEMMAELEKVINVWFDVKDVLSILKNERNYKKLVKIQDELLEIKVLFQKF